MTTPHAPEEGGTTTEPQDDQETGSTQPPDNTTDDQDTGQQDNDNKDEGKTFTQADVDKLIADRIRRERTKYAGHDDLKKKAAEFDKLEAAKKTEVEKLNDQLTAAQVELQGFRVAEIRRNAATEVGLDPELAQFITAAEPDEAVAQAKTLADKFKPAEPKRADLKQGTRPPAKPAISQDDFIRRLAGYSTQ